MNVREIMTTDVIKLAPDMTVEDARELLLRYHIHGAPVVQLDGQLVGMVSFTDLARHAGEETTVRQVMSASVAASEDAGLDEVARLMLDEMVRRVVSTHGGRVVGIVSASDIVQLFVNLHEQPRIQMPRPQHAVAGRLARR